MKYFYLLLCLLLVNCAHNTVKRSTTASPSSGDGHGVLGEMAADDQDGSDDDIGPDPAKEAPIKVGKNMPQYEDLSDNESDMKFIPQDFNQSVDKWIAYFQGKGRPHMERYLSRSTRYLPKMKEILKSHGLPEDLVYISLIESGFNGRAFSRARASGYWQFIRGTARRYNLKIDYYRDERNDFVASTEAAAQYFKALYNLFGSWYLAMASYNVGENRVKNVVMKYYTRDFWEMARMRKLPKETVNYVPKFLAARLIAKHPEKYGFTNVAYLPPLDYQEVNFDKSVSLTTLAEQLGMDLEELSGLNPAYKKGVIPKYGDAPVMVRVPSKLDKSRVLAAMENSSSAVAMSQAVAKAEEDYTRYRIRNGDTLSTIARRFKVSMGSLIEANDLGRRAIIRAGKVLLIPQGGRSISSKRRPTSSIEKIRMMKAKRIAQRSKASSKRSPAAVGFAKNVFIPKAHAATKTVRVKKHKVRSGDTLIQIADKYNVKMSKLITVNKLASKGKILIGSTLVIPQ